MIIEKRLNFLGYEERESKKGNKYQMVSFLDNGDVVKVLDSKLIYLEPLEKFQEFKVTLKVVMGKYSRFELVDIA